MSAQKALQENDTPNPRQLVGLALELRQHLRRHRSMGIATYPATSSLQAFVNGSRNNTGTSKQSVTGTTPVSQPFPQPVVQKIKKESLTEVHHDILSCTACDLGSDQQGGIPGTGEAGAVLIALGDGVQPGGIEQTGVFFGEQEDELFWKMMAAIGLGKADVYVSNTVKCCPVPPQQVSDRHRRRCREHLLREIQAVQPKVILGMGEITCTDLLGRDIQLLRLRGRWQKLHQQNGVVLPIMPTFHPRMLLQHEELKRPVWQDLQQVRRRLLG
ncbi:MAG: hypothetical protein CSA34_00675 [Desulfobulbus propionicus]|nr:MAG: hypothetical protein CSA34_00675 [Desulfobulbus propionicus]